MARTKTPHTLAGRAIAEHRTEPDWARLAIDAAPVPIAVVDRNGIVRDCNPACAAWFHRVAADLVGQKFDEAGSAIGLATNAQHARRALDGDTARFLTLALRTEAGVRMVEGTYVPYRDEAAVITGYVACLVDVTDRERSLEYLRGLDERFRPILDALPDGVLVERRGRIEYANEAAARLLRRAASELIGAGLLDQVPAEERNTLKGRLAQSERWSGTVAWYRAGGDRAAVETLVAPVAWSGEPAKLVHLRANAAAAAPRFTGAHYRKLLDMATDAAYVHRAGVVVMANEHAERLFGGSTGLVGRSALDLVHPDDRETVRHRMTQEIGEGATTSLMEQRRLRLDGSEFRAQIAATPIELDGERAAIVVVRDISERRRAAERLRESEDYFRKLAEVSFDAILEIEDGVIRDVYGRVKELCGYDRKELVGKEGKVLASPGMRAEVERRIGALIEGTHESEILHKDGRVIPVEVAARHFPRNGRDIRIAAMRDISERKRAEAGLRESEELFRNLAEASFDAALVMEDGVIRDVNGRATDLYGYSREELIGNTTAMIAAPQERQEVDRRIGTHVDGTYDTAVVRKNGEIVPVEVSAKNFVRDGRNVRISTMRDITERKRAENELRESEARYRRLFEAFPYAIYVQVRDRIMFVNAAAVELFGFGSADHMLGRSAIGLYHPDEREFVLRRRAQLLEDGPMRPSAELRFVRSDGSVFHGEAVATPVSWAGQRGLLAIVCDISERKKAIAAITEAKESAELANRTKSDFLANVSHELRTPLNAIIGFSDIMTNELVGPLGNEAYKAYAGDVMTSGRHLLAIINDILDISKIEAGKLVLVDGVFSLREALAASIKFVEGRAGERSIDLAWHAPENLPYLRGDEQKVRQILINLLSNAVKFTPGGGSIRATAEVAADGSMVIVVADTGIGIAPADVDKVLVPFVQVESGLDRSYEGTGLGLPIAKSLAELHGGSLTLESTLGRGTKVIVRFPEERVVRA
jgi:PAS domain S-box-containing protein